MALGLVPVLLGGGAVAYVAVKQAPIAPNNVGANGAPISKAGNGTAPGVTIGSLVQNTNRLALASRVRDRGISRYTGRAEGNASARTTNWGSGSGGTGTSGGNVDPAVQQKLDEIEKAASAAYDQLSADAKKAGADALNKGLKLDPPLTGDEDWKSLSEIAGGAAGGAIGGYIGGPLGAKLGAICGAYLGVKIEEWLSGSVDDVKNWVKKEWGDVEQAAKDVANKAEGYAKDAGNAAEDAYNYVSGWF